MLEGKPDSPILVIVANQTLLARNMGLVLPEEWKLLYLKFFARAGIDESSVSFTTLTSIDLISAHPARVLVPIDNASLESLTGLDSVDKWHCSVISATPSFGGRKCIPLLGADRVIKNYTDMVYLQLGCQKIAQEMHFPQVAIIDRTFHLNPPLKETLLFLERAKNVSVAAIDIETSNGMINTFGVAISGYEAIAIKTLPLNYTVDEHYILWDAIKRFCESPVKKVIQNQIYEALFLSRYGIYINNIHHDTMWAMKFIYPELEKGLHNVGRFFTPFPYWKDEAKEWTNIKDWTAHLTYNCKDTTATLWAYHEQVKALKELGTFDLFYNFVMQFAEPIREMCSRGLIVDEEKIHNIRIAEEHKLKGHLELVEHTFKERLGRPVNIRSPQQLQNAIKQLGYKLPVTKNRETADKKALVKLRKNYPDDPLFNALIEAAASNKQLSSYLNFDYDREAKRVHYTLDGCATETGRWASYTDPWARGFNAQTVPKVVRRAFKATPGKVLIQIDLSQAESRYVAYESPEPKLMEMLETGKDVHKYVASRIFNRPEELVTKMQRQLGKKSGHAANYGVGPRTFAEACLTEMNMVVSEQEARRIIDGYYQAFPGIRKRQERIQRQISKDRCLVTPMGRKRIFYDRIGDSVFREAYAYAPQSTIPDITNSLMLFLWRTFEDCEFLLQIHDALLLQVESGRQFEIAEAARSYNDWHPNIQLPGGKLIIPVDVECGEYWEPMERI